MSRGICMCTHIELGSLKVDEESDGGVRNILSHFMFNFSILKDSLNFMEEFNFADTFAFMIFFFCTL